MWYVIFQQKFSKIYNSVTGLIKFSDDHYHNDLKKDLNNKRIYLLWIEVMKFLSVYLVS